MQFLFGSLFMIVGIGLIGYGLTGLLSCLVHFMMKGSNESKD